MLILSCTVWKVLTARKERSWTVNLWQGLCRHMARASFFIVELTRSLSQYLISYIYIYIDRYIDISISQGCTSSVHLSVNLPAHFQSSVLVCSSLPNAIMAIFLRNMPSHHLYYQIVVTSNHKLHLCWSTAYLNSRLQCLHDSNLFVCMKKSWAYYPLVSSHLHSWFSHSGT